MGCAEAVRPRWSERPPLLAPVELEEEVFDQQIAFNLKSVFLTMKHVLPVMERQGGGSIVNNASIAAWGWCGVNYGLYGTSKGGMVSMTRSIAIQYARKGIRANCVCPGWIDTPFNEPAIEFMGGRESQEAMVQQAVPLQRQGKPADIAPGILYLASDASSYMTGQELVIDGGVL